MARQINIAVPDDLYARAKALAKAAPAFFKAWIAKAVEEKCDRDERKAGK
jgi:post-segregation antitoxin (ccd killing protein)